MILELLYSLREKRNRGASLLAILGRYHCSMYLFVHVDELLQTSRVGSHEAVHHFAALEEYECWHGTNAVLGSCVGVLVHIHL